MFGFKKQDGFWIWLGGNIASGAAAGATSSLFVYSLDFARTRLANDAKSTKGGGARQYNGIIDVYRKTLATDGVVGLYRGFGPSIVGIMIYRGGYFGFYDSLSKDSTNDLSMPDRKFRACCLGGTSGGIPLSFVPTRMGGYYWIWSRCVPYGHDKVWSLVLHCYLS